MRQSSLTDPLSDAEVDAANADPSELWIHVRCQECGDVECCYNRTEVAWEKVCFPCLMVWKSPKKSVRDIANEHGFNPVDEQTQQDTFDRETRF